MSRLQRYERQIAYLPLGLEAQRALMRSRALIVGVGGIGSWAAELLARAGVGFLRLVDDDDVELNNIHRQALYDESDAREGLAKVKSAAAHLRGINGDVTVEPVIARVDKSNIASLADGVGAVIDGTDNFATRFLINDFAVKTGTPWVFAGVIGCEGQTMPIVPGRTPCLRCVLESPPLPCQDPSCRQHGVLGPAVAAIASFQAAEAIKILSGRLDAVSPFLTKIDLWTGRLQQVDAAKACADVDCRCCKHREFDYLEA